MLPSFRRFNVHQKQYLSDKYFSITRSQTRLVIILHEDGSPGRNPVGGDPSSRDVRTVSTSRVNVHVTHSFLTIVIVIETHDTVSFPSASERSEYTSGVVSDERHLFKMRIGGWIDGRINGRMDGLMDGRTDGKTDGETDERTNGRVDIWRDR